MIVTPFTHEPIHKTMWDVHMNGNIFPGLTMWDVHKNGNIFLGLTVCDIHMNGNVFPGLTKWDAHKNGNVFLGLTVCDIHTNGNVFLGFTVWDVHTYGNVFGIHRGMYIPTEMIGFQFLARSHTALAYVPREPIPDDFSVVWEGPPLSPTLTWRRFQMSSRKGVKNRLYSTDVY